MEFIKELEKGEHSFEGKAWLPFQNEYIELYIEEYDELDNRHIDLIKSLNISGSLKNHIESAFHNACESFKHATGLTEPNLDSQSDIWKHIEFYSMRIDSTSLDGNDTYLVLEASGKWESEHAYELVVKNGHELVYLGSFLCYPASSYAEINGDDENYALRVV